MDLATRSGFCNWGPDRQPTIGNKDLSHASSEVGRYLSIYEKWLIENITENKVDCVVFEAPILIRMGKKTTGIETAYKLMNLAGSTERVCWDLDVMCSSVQVSEWRKHFLGSGGYPTDQAKAMCVEKCKAIGLDPKYHDEAEAFGIMDYATAILRLEKPWPDSGLLRFTR